MAVETDPTSLGFILSNVAVSTVLATFGTALLNSIFPKLLDHRWAQKLEEAKSELAKEANRLLKVHGKQFDILPDLWAKANYAYGAIQLCAELGFVVSIDGQNEDDQREIMKHEEFSEQQIERVLNHAKPTLAFSKELVIRRFGRADRLLKEFSNEYFIQELFLTKKIAGEFQGMRGELSNLMVQTYIKQNSNKFDQKLIDQIHADLVRIKANFDELRLSLATHLGVDQA